MVARLPTRRSRMVGLAAGEGLDVGQRRHRGPIIGSDGTCRKGAPHRNRRVAGIGMTAGVGAWGKCVPGWTAPPGPPPRPRRLAARGRIRLRPGPRARDACVCGWVGSSAGRCGCRFLACASWVARARRPPLRDDVVDDSCRHWSSFWSSFSAESPVAPHSSAAGPAPNIL